MGSGDMLERLRALGVSDEAIDALFAYVEPDEKITADEMADLLEWVAATSCRLVVGDAFNPILTIFGLDMNSTEDVERFYKGTADKFCDAGCAVVMLDHLVKNPDTSRRYTIGSERKATGAHVHVGMVTIAPYGRGRTGKAKLTVHKDRPGFLTRPTHGLFVLESDPFSGDASWRVEPDAAAQASGDEWKPTGLMERVSRFLERLEGGEASGNAIEKDVPGKAEYIRRAIAALEQGEYVVRYDGPNRSRMVKLVQAYREPSGDAS
jgi:hypothetical protein